MKKIIITILFAITTQLAFSQKNYLSISSGIFFNSPIKDWRNTMGASIEYGRYLKSKISIGVNFGYWSFYDGFQYNGIKITYPIWASDYYSFSFSGGINYFYKQKDLLLEYDFNSNLFISKDKQTSLILNYCSQSGLGYENAKSFNFGIERDF